MKRIIETKLLEWKQEINHKPLVIRGVRQCGKTYSLKEFGKKHYEHYYYFNFEKNPPLKAAFEYDIDCRRILKEMCLIMGYGDIMPKKDLVIFDEIQECPKAITSLKYFNEDLPEYDIVSAGSLIGVSIDRKGSSFPVGKVEMVDMWPMTFMEFLWANVGADIVDLISSYSLDREIPEVIEKKLTHWLRTFYAVGGMPEAVKKWAETNDYEKTANVLDGIIQGYREDFGKHLSPEEALKASWIWESITVQLAKENQKFVFSHVKQGKRASQLEDALLWLNSANMAHSLTAVQNPQLPLKAFEDKGCFKLYMSDIGLLSRQCGISVSNVIDNSPLFSTFRGALTENFVLNELLALGIKPYYWRSGNSAEVDFIFQHKGHVIPLEAKSEVNTRAKSFALFCKRYLPELGFKLSMKNVGFNLVDTVPVYSLPLYLIWRLPSYLNKE